ncbi:hypothetical protein ACN083_07780 [Rothia sp. CCM 9418]|uniref:hypothetical protein n=1 Tax=Rothia sp. CCM 9418 TaxID=3402661 RepID=UPI003AEB3032
MKSLPVSLLLVATLITQAMGMFSYTNDSMGITGQVFFPIIFILLQSYLVFRNPQAADKYKIGHFTILGLALLTLVATVVGFATSFTSLYPSPYLYYVALLLLVIEVSLIIAALPPKENKPPKPPAQKTPHRHGSTRLVATSTKNNSSETTK